MPTTEEIAMELALKNSQIIRETRLQAIENAKKKGFSQEDYYFEDNIEEVIDDPTIPYKLVLKLKQKGENN